MIPKYIKFYLIRVNAMNVKRSTTAEDMVVCELEAETTVMQSRFVIRRMARIKLSPRYDA